MAITNNTADNEKYKFVEADDVAGQPAVAVVNPDGSSIGATGTGASAPQSQGTAADNAASVGNPVKVGGRYESGTDTYADGDVGDLHIDENGNLKIINAGLQAGEDLANDVQKVEQRFTYGRVTADGAIKSGAGFVHTVTFAATGGVTAGVITLYDNTSETGTVIFSGTIQTGLNPTTITLNTSFNTGLYVGYDGTIANVQTTVSYR